MLVDTSHLTFLSRAAVLLAGESGEDVHDTFAELLHAVSCSRLDRIMTTEVVFHDQVDPQSSSSRVVQELGGPGQRMTWGSLIGTVDEFAAHGMILSQDIDVLGKHDCSLIGNSAVRSRLGTVFLVANDEQLLMYTTAKMRHLRKVDNSIGSVTPLSSLHAAKAFFQCGAFSQGVMNACLTAEHRDVLSRPLTTSKREKKLARIRRVAAELVLPDPTS